jgi:hypothetical protein
MKQNIEEHITNGLMTYRYAFIMLIIGTYTVIFEIPTYIVIILQNLSNKSSEFNQ